jgi:hypothetical protein
MLRDAGITLSCHIDGIIRKILNSCLIREKKSFRVLELGTGCGIVSHAG